ncbi:hypothetical protein acdb102_41700 [Acidothermaceae bacterium B102]|nr:hypothetical protein acdb102_41700 [Acidothermaceae bacterium B102]
MSNRRKPLVAKASRADKHLTFLTVTEADRVRELMREALVARGLTVRVNGDHLQVPDGPTLGLWNVAALCHGSDPTDLAWRAVVAAHVDKVMFGYVGGDPFDGLPKDELLSRVYTKLWPDNLLLEFEAPSVPFVPGLSERLCLDVPGGAALISTDRVERFGGWDELHAAGLANLEARPFEFMELVPTPIGGHYWRLTGDLYTASKALLLPGLLPTLEAGVPELADVGMGWLMSMPNRNEICWHMVQDGGVLVSLNFMMAHSAEAYTDAPGQLSPHVFWWSGHDYRQVTYIDARSQLRIGSDPDFEPLVLGLTDAA